MVLFIEYPQCSTCQKAKKYLNDNAIAFTARHIVNETPTKEELAVWFAASKLPLKRFFNTSGKLYRELNVKEKFDSMSEDELLTLLSQNGMLIKRPLLITESEVLVGFKEKEYAMLK